MQEKSRCDHHPVKGWFEGRIFFLLFFSQLPTHFKGKFDNNTMATQKLATLSIVALPLIMGNLSCTKINLLPNAREITFASDTTLSLQPGLINEKDWYANNAYELHWQEEIDSCYSIRLSGYEEEYEEAMTSYNLMAETYDGREM